MEHRKKTIKTITLTLNEYSIVIVYFIFHHRYFTTYNNYYKQKI